MNNLFEIESVVKYRPNRGNDFRKNYKENALILDTKIKTTYNDISKLYMYFIKSKYGQNEYKNIQIPMFNLHSTIVKGNEYINLNDIEVKNYLGSIIGKKIKLGYDPTTLYKHWKFWCILLDNDTKNTINDIRKNLKLSVLDNPHITIARQIELNKIY